MKLRRSNQHGFVFQLSPREQELLFDTLKLYPLVPARHHRLTRAAAHQSEENQHLLEAALAEQRTENRRQVEAWLNAPERLQPSDTHFVLRLTPAEMEWLLQVLNDIRVGSWLALGEPDQDKPPQVTSENFRYALALEVAAGFESVLLAALGATESPDWLG
jgi:hypothetical protein